MKPREITHARHNSIESPSLGLSFSNSNRMIPDRSSSSGSSSSSSSSNSDGSYVGLINSVESSNPCRSSSPGRRGIRRRGHFLAKAARPRVSDSALLGGGRFVPGFNLLTNFGIGC